MKDATALLRAFTRELSRAGGLLSPDYLASGLTVGEARCLYELGHADGLEVSVLAERLDLDVGHVSRVVSRLVERGLVSKRVSAEDARARAVVITAAGRKQLAKLDARANARLAGYLAGKRAPAVARLAAALHSFLDVDDRVVIRAPRPGAIGHIIARHAEVYVRDLGYPPAFEPYVVQTFAELLADFAPPRDRIWVAERGGVFAGSVAVKGRARNTAQLRFLIVEPEARGLGIGKRLVKQVLDHARAHGERKVVLETASDLVAARAIYAAEGFRLVASVDGEGFLPAGVASERWELAL